MEVWYSKDIDTDDMVIAGSITQKSVVEYKCSRRTHNDMHAYVDIANQKMYVHMLDLETEYADILATNPHGYTNLTQANFNVARDKILNS